MKTIFAYALSHVSNREDVEDLAGDIILAILQSVPRIRDDNAFFGYIWAIATNTYKTLYLELSLLSREYKECIIAYYFDGLSCAETASRLHISLEMVKYYLLRTHAPENVAPMVDNVVANTLFFDTVGVMGACAVKSGELTVPGDDLPAAVMIVRE